MTRRTIQLATCAALAARIPGVTTLVVEGSGHSPHWERSDIFNAALRRFLRSGAK